MKKFELVDLLYEMNALEPYISKMTLEYHHGKQHITNIYNVQNSQTIHTG